MKRTSLPLQRRDFMALLGGVAAWPIAAQAQPPERVRRIGVLMAYAESDGEGQAWIAAFREGLQKVGWAEGRNTRIDLRWAADDVELMQRFAKESSKPSSTRIRFCPTRCRRIASASRDRDWSARARLCPERA